MAETTSVRLQMLAGTSEEFAAQWSASRGFRDTLRKYLTEELNRAIIDSEKVENLEKSAFMQHNAGERKTLRSLINTISDK